MTRRISTAGKVGIAAAAAVLVVAAVGAAQALRIHHEDGQWALVHPAAPKRLLFKGHTYERGSSPRSITRGGPDEPWPSVDIAWRGTTRGGGIIYSPSAGPDPAAVIWVQEDAQHSRTWQYQLADNP